MGNHAQPLSAVRRLVCVLVAAVGAGRATGASHAQAVRDYISIVGSSTVYPFATVVAEQFGRHHAASRRRRSSRPAAAAASSCSATVSACSIPTSRTRRGASRQSEVDDLREERRDGNRRGQDRLRRHRAREREVRRRTSTSRCATCTSRSRRTFPIPRARRSSCRIRTRSGRRSTRSCRRDEIEVLGPPPTSGTRDAFLELVMEGGCKTFPCVAALDDATRSLRPATRCARTAPTSRRARTTT